MKLPNGYGSVYKLSGNRRKPWAARVTDGWVNDNKTKKSKQKYKFIGFYETRKEALLALASFPSWVRGLKYFRNKTNSCG